MKTKGEETNGGDSLCISSIGDVSLLLSGLLGFVQSLVPLVLVLGQIRRRRTSDSIRDVLVVRFVSGEDSSRFLDCRRGREREGRRSRRKYEEDSVREESSRTNRKPQPEKKKEKDPRFGFLFVRSLLFAVFLIASYNFACLNFFFDPSNFGSKIARAICFPFSPFFVVAVVPLPANAVPPGELGPLSPPPSAIPGSLVAPSFLSASFSGLGFHFLFHRWKQSQGERRSIESVRREVLNASEMSCQLNGN